MQVKDAWPNLFRQARFLSAVDFVQADRFRRKVALEMARIFTEVDVLLVPSLRDEQLTITNFTGHPSLTLRAGFVEVSEARSDWAPDPAIRCRNSRRRAACRTASRSSAGCSMKEQSRVRDSRSSERRPSPGSGRRDSKFYRVPELDGASKIRRFLTDHAGASGTVSVCVMRTNFARVGAKRDGRARAVPFPFHDRLAPGRAVGRDLHPVAARDIRRPACRHPRAAAPPPCAGGCRGRGSGSTSGRRTARRGRRWRSSGAAPRPPRPPPTGLPIRTGSR